MTVEEMCGTVWNTMLYGTTAKCTTKAEILSVNANTPVYIKD